MNAIWQWWLTRKDLVVSRGWLESQRTAEMKQPPEQICWKWPVVK